MGRCPRCKTKTTRVAYEGANVRMCGQCGGCWVTPIALTAIANRRDTAFTEAVKERFLQLAEESDSAETLLCISCATYMVKEHYKDWDDIVIDRCEKCGGIWLDPGELEKIQVYWEYFQDHPEQSNLDAIAKRALLENAMAQRSRDMTEARDEFQAYGRRRGIVGPGALRGALHMLFGR
jgi:Zn-finger nucleic acid-binding protein